MPFFFVFLISFVVNARTLEPINSSYDYSHSAEYKTILPLVKSKGNFTTTMVEKQSRPMSRGEQIVEEAKARNRALIASNQKEVDRAKSVQEQWKDEVKKTQDGWKKEVLETRARWQKEQDIFLGRIKEYQQTTFEIPAPKEKIVEVEVPKERLPQVHIVNSAFSIPIRDQRRRPTCAAFAGIRAIEIILAQNGESLELSPHYFYWASKPKCQQSPCQEKGSWVTPGYLFSKNFKYTDIPLEKSCPYNVGPIDGNETQLPLTASCHAGMIKVEGFKEVRTLADTVNSLKMDIPVVMAAKLSWNFYRNQGLVTLSDSLKPSPDKLDHHSMGHAFLGVGLMELPEKIHQEEGTYCIVMANSWGKGWGAGGYSCLTEKWLQKYRQNSAFVAVTKLRLK